MSATLTATQAHAAVLDLMRSRVPIEDAWPLIHHYLCIERRQIWLKHSRRAKRQRLRENRIQLALRIKQRRAEQRAAALAFARRQETARHANSVRWSRGRERKSA